MTVIYSKPVSRRAVLIAAAGAAPLVALGGAQAAQLPQAAVSYQATPKDGKRCDECKFFTAPNGCKSVAGEIAAAGWCKLYAKKA